MFPVMFWVKYLLRICHIGSLVVLCQEIINAKMTGEVATNHKWLYASAGILVMVSGKDTLMQAWSTPSSSNQRRWASEENYGSLTVI